MAIKKNRIVCNCNGVTEKEILQILKRGARNLEDVKKFTLASTSCGRCKNETEAIIQLYFNSKSPNIQTHIDF